MSELLRETFKKFDKNGDGYLSPKEIKEVLEGFAIKATKEEVDKFISEADTDKDGKVNYDG